MGQGLRLNPRRLQAANWECVHFAEQADVAELHWDEAAAMVRRTFDAEGVNDNVTLFDRVAEALDFPDYFGRNWDALHECLRDLDWLAGDGYALVGQNAGAIWSAAPLVAGGLVGLWEASNGEIWLPQGTPFHLIWAF